MAEKADFARQQDLRVFMNLSGKHLAVVGGVIVVAVVAWRVIGTDGHGKGGGVRAAIPVTALEIVARDVPAYRTGIGTAQAYNTVTVRARVDGELTRVAFQEGQEVKKGEVLAQIDARSYEANLHNVVATLAKDQAALANAKNDLTRYADTVAKGYTSRQQFDTQTSTVNTLSAAVQADEASVENARVQLSYTTITAPIDGRTGIRGVDQGNIVHANDLGGLVIITQVQPIAAIFTLPQDQLPEVSQAHDHGQLAVTALSRDGAAAFDQGTLELIDNQIDPTTGTIKLKASFPNTAHKLWPGQFINVRLQVGIVHNGVAVPTRVVQRGDRGAYVYVIKKDDTVEARLIEIGAEDHGQTLVTKGLATGEWVVLDGQLRLQPGAKVKVESAGALHEGTGDGVGQAGAQPS
jgi:multidrug efflux system membrane fusion protein